MKLPSKPEEPFGWYFEFAGQELFHEVHHDGRTTGSKNCVLNVLRDCLSYFLFVYEPCEPCPVVSDCSIDWEMALEVRIADFVVFEFTLQQDIVFCSVSEKKWDFWCLSLRSFNFADILDDLIERCDACSSSDEADVVILFEGVAVISTLLDPYNSLILTMPRPR